MYREHRIGAVVPVYNEAAFVGDVLDSLPSFVDRAYPVDDCSSDGSWEIIEQRASVTVDLDDQPIPVETTTGSPDRSAPEIRPDGAGADTQSGRDGSEQPKDGEREEPTPDGGHATAAEVVPIRHETNQGRGGAVKTGYRAALADGMDIIVVMDGDGQMDPGQLDRLIDPIVTGVADYAKGNRLATAESRDGMSTWRLFGNALLTGLTRVASGYWQMTDPQSGYTAISRETLQWLDIDELYDDYGFLNDILVCLNANDARIVDVPMPAVYGDEKSGIQYHSFVPRLSLLLAAGFIRRLRSTDAAFGVGPVGALYGLATLIGVGTAGVVVGTLVTGRPGVDPLDILAVFALCPLFVVVAVLVERRSNRDLYVDPARVVEDRV